MRKSKVKTDGTGHLSCTKWAQKKGMTDKIIKVEEAENGAGTSVFDPVLCEIVYRWFCPEGGAVIDPFAGGSVRGIVAGYLGHPYTGIDLRADQIAANEIQATAISPKVKPRWIVGNSEQIAELAPGEYDLVFSCPPYYDLEIYSDSPAPANRHTENPQLEWDTGELMFTDNTEIGYQPTGSHFVCHCGNTVGVKHTEPVGVPVVVNGSDIAHKGIFKRFHFGRIVDCLNVFLNGCDALHSSTFRRRLYKGCDVEAVILQRYKDTFPGKEIKLIA